MLDWLLFLNYFIYKYETSDIKVIHIKFTWANITSIISYEAYKGEPSIGIANPLVPIVRQAIRMILVNYHSQMYYMKCNWNSYPLCIIFGILGLPTGVIVMIFSDVLNQHLTMNNHRAD